MYSVESTGFPRERIMLYTINVEYVHLSNMHMPLSSYFLITLTGASRTILTMVNMIFLGYFPLS